MKEELNPSQLEMRLLLSNNLKRLRAARGLSQEGLADLAGLHRTYVSQLERMITNGSMDNLALVAQALAVAPAELFADNQGEAEPVDNSDGKKVRRGTSKI
ncbi:DNA-binding protein [Caballeronia udeis]|uniref:DNA-binding protein n=1 Tax=Caballeronia udeis TaxID=1232866 RepID=A0A158IY35_9BURK|nr:helix-turn-helix transcriptional regulator [Caballeronia udeis]SAL61506.1 DNA-binding protein [Caballeronia udeis]